MTEKKTGIAKKSGFSMKYRILLTMLLVSLIPLSGLWYISIYRAEVDEREAVQSRLKDIAANLVLRADNWYDTNLLILQQNSALADMQSMAAAKQEPVLKTITNNYKWIYLAFTVQPDGMNVGRSDGQPAQNYADREYFRQVMQGQMIGHQVVIGKTSNKPALIVAAPLYGADTVKKGVMAFAMTLEDLSATVTDISLGKTGNAILLDDKNRVVAKNKELLSSLENLSAHPAVVAAGKKQDLVDFDEKGKRMLAFAQTTKHGWKLIVQQEHEEAFATLVQTRNHALALLVATLAVTTLIAFMLSAGLAGPIKTLTGVADSMSRGELEVEIKEIQRKDEIGDLARAIQRMGISLKMAFERMRK